MRAAIRCSGMMKQVVLALSTLGSHADLVEAGASAVLASSIQSRSLIDFFFNSTPFGHQSWSCSGDNLIAFMEAGGIRVVINTASQFTENARLQENVLKLVHLCAATSGMTLS